MSIGIFKNSFNHINQLECIRAPLRQFMAIVPLPGAICTEFSSLFAKKTVHLIGSTVSFCSPGCIRQYYHEYSLNKAEHHLDYLKPLIYSSPYLVNAMLLTAAIYEQSPWKSATIHLSNLSLLPFYLILSLIAYFPSLQHWIEPGSLLGNHLSSVFEKVKPQVAQQVILPLVQHSHRFILKQVATGLFYVAYQYYLSSHMFSFLSQTMSSAGHIWHWTDYTVTWFNRATLAYTYAPILWHSTKVTYHFFQAYRKLDTPEQRLLYTNTRLYKKNIYDLSTSELRALATILSSRGNT